MTWTFTDSATPSAKDQVRILIDDVDTADQQVSDEGINLFLTGGSLAQANVYTAAAAVCERLARRFGRQAQSLSAGGTSASWGDRAKSYTDLARSLRLTAARNSITGPVIGGVSISARDAVEDDSDRVPAAFTTRTGDFAGVSAAVDADWDDR